MASVFRKGSIAFVSPFAYPLLSDDPISGSGGAERQLFLFARFLSKEGWEVSFITDKSNKVINVKAKIFNIYNASFSYLGGSKLRIPLDWLSLISAMKSANAKYYVIKVPGHLLAPMSFFCKTYNRKLIFWAQMSFDANPNERSNINPVACLLQDWGLKKTDLVIAQSEDQKKGFKENYCINAQVVPSICDSLSTIHSMEEKLNAINKKVDVLWVGNSLPKKRQEIFFELAKLLRHRTLAMAMNNCDRIRFKEAKVNAKNLTNVIFLGRVPPVEMESWFRKTRLFINTSTQEGFPNTFLQAWMNGVPVVSLNINPDNIISKHMLGIVAANKTQIEKLGDDFRSMAQLLAAKIETLIENVEMRKKIGKRAIHYVTHNHSPFIVVQKFCQALQSINGK